VLNHPPLKIVRNARIKHTAYTRKNVDMVGHCVTLPLPSSRCHELL
jgi:hypothetical protein